MVKSHICYGLSAWGPTVNTMGLKRLNTIIKSGIRCVAGVSRRTHSAPLMKKYKQLYIDDLIRMKVCSEYLTLRSAGNQNNGLAEYFHESKHARRNKIRSRDPTVTSTKQTNIINLAYDMLALDLRPKTRLSRIKTQLLKNYDETCTINHCNICN